MSPLSVKNNLITCNRNFSVSSISPTSF